MGVRKYKNHLKLMEFGLNIAEHIKKYGKGKKHIQI